MNHVVIEALDIPEAWWKCMKAVLEQGYEYTIQRGSFETKKRKEFDAVSIIIKNPGIRPLVPITCNGVPPPCNMKYIEEEYLPYLMSEYKAPNEDYTYGEDIAPQLDPIAEMLRNTPNTNQSFIAVGDKNSIKLKDPQCLRGIQCRVRYGKLHFLIYYRSWDLWGGFPANLAGIQLMKEALVDKIGNVEDGELIAFSGGLHLYDHTWEWARKVIHAETN